MVTEFVVSTITYMENNLQAEAAASIIFIAMAFLIGIAIVLFTFRKTRLWYWKTDEQIHTLQEIDISLGEIRQGIKEVNESVQNLAIGAVAPAVGQAPEERSEAEEEAKDTQKILEERLEAELGEIVFQDSDFEIKEESTEEAEIAVDVDLEQALDLELEIDSEAVEETTAETFEDMLRKQIQY